MRTYLIATKESDYSKNSALSVIENYSKYLNKINYGHYNPVMYWGVDRYNSRSKLLEYNLTIKDEDEINKYSYVEEVLGCFLSHYELWNKSVEYDEPILILEHDVVILSNPITMLENIDKNSQSLLNVGRPIWSDETFGHLGGTHSYIVTPYVANKLIDSAKNNGVTQADVFLNRDIIDIVDVKPFVFEQLAKFSLIQKEDNFGKWGNGVEDQNNLICGETAWNDSSKSKKFQNERRNK